MADDASILAVAQAERDQVTAALAAHVRDAHPGQEARCATCWSLEAHLDRAQRQVELLAGEPAGDEVPLW